MMQANVDNEHVVLLSAVPSVLLTPQQAVFFTLPLWLGHMSFTASVTRPHVFYYCSLYVGYFLIVTADFLFSYTANLL